MLAKEEAENGVISVLQTTDCATVLRAMIIVCERGQSPSSRRIYCFNSTVQHSLAAEAVDITLPENRYGYCRLKVIKR